MTMSKDTRKRKHDEEEKANDDDDHDLDRTEDGQMVDGIYIPPPAQPHCSLDPNGPRLIITKIENTFFKSYAKGEVLGPFHKCFNAIVGPNGSGKSNVIDSMLFVFGYRATKIRSKKVSVLLHNSENFRDVQSCTVSVHFALIIDKEGDEYDVVENSEFVISRTGLKDNSSYYTLNGNRVQFKEIGLLLKKYGIDLDHNRFLILQGEVEQIAMMKCKGETEHDTGMLEYLEDIIGTSRYKKPLVQLNDRVELLAENRNEKLNRLKLVQNELDELKGPMEEAVKFLKEENTIVTCKNFLYQKNAYLLQKQLTQNEEEHTTVTEAHKELSDQIKQLGREKSERAEALKHETKKYEDLQRKKDQLKEQFDVANKKDIQLQETMTRTNKTRKEVKALLGEERKKLEDLKELPEKNKNLIEENNAKEEKLTAEKEELEAKKIEMLSAIREDTKELQEKKEVLQTDLVVLKKSVDETKSALTLAESELKIFRSNEDNEKQKLEKLMEMNQTTTESIEQQERVVETLKKKIPVTEKSLTSNSRELESLRSKEQQTIGEIRKKRYYLEETRQSMQASKSRGRVLDSLFQQKREGKCDGLFGRLGDLGAIDSKYDVAVSTACGPLDNIVVDNVATAQWCIEFLKEYNIGRATFIALDKQEYLRRAATTSINTPENVPRLFDLIKVQDERVIPAFYYALRDTLVAKDLDQASRIGYGAKRYRVVTLGGALIETTGTMSGGGNSVSRGRMGQSVATKSVDPKELDNLDKEVVHLEQQVRDWRQKQLNLEDQIRTSQTELKQMKITYEKSTVELRNLKQQAPQLAKQLKEQEARTKTTKANPQRIKELTKIVETKKVTYDEAFETAAKLQAQVDVITAEITKRSSGKISAIDKRIRDLRNNIDKLKADTTKLAVAAKTSVRNTQKCEEKIEDMQKDVASMEERLLKMRDQRQEIETAGKQILADIDEIAVDLAANEEAYLETKKEVEKMEKKVNKLKSEEVDINQKLKTIKSKIHELKSKIQQWETQRTRLKLQEIPNETTPALQIFTEEELESRPAEPVEKELKGAESCMKAAKPNLNVIHEYKETQKVFVTRTKELEEVSAKRNQMKALFDHLRTQRKEEFLKGYNIIKMKLKEMYQMITLEGDADFEMVDTFDPFTEGILLNVRPPKKSWKHISNLSGGEKTLSSLALVFALHYYKPSPLYVMDEIDAALDFRNVSIVGHYIKDRTKNAQFIIISLRSNMFELCDNLIGIYKTFNTTKTITIDPRVYDDNDKQEKQDQGGNVTQQVLEARAEHSNNATTNTNLLSIQSENLNGSSEGNANGTESLEQPENVSENTENSQNDSEMMEVSQNESGIMEVSEIPASSSDESSAVS